MLQRNTVSNHLFMMISKAARLDHKNLSQVITVAFWLGISMGTGFLRQAMAASFLGTARQADMFLVAYMLPEFFYIALPIVLIPVLIPVISRLRLESDRASIFYWLVTFSAKVCLVLLLFIILAFISAPIYIPWLASGFQPGELSQTVALARLMLPSILLFCLSAIVTAAYQAYHQFSRSILSTIFYNFIFAALLLLSKQGNLLFFAGYSVLLGAAGALLVQVAFSLSAIIHLRFSLKRLHSAKPAQATFSNLMVWTGPLAAGYLVHHLILWIDRVMAISSGSGYAASLAYAYQLAQVPGQLSGLAVSIVIYPKLAEYAQTGQQARLKKTLMNSLLWVFWIAIPLLVGLAIFREPVIRLLFERGAFNARSTGMVGQALIWYTLAVFADALCQPLWRYIYLRQKSWTVFYVNGLQTLVRLVANIALIQSFGYQGLAISAGLGLFFQLVVLLFITRARLSKPEFLSMETA